MFSGSVDWRGEGIADSRMKRGLIRLMDIAGTYGCTRWQIQSGGI
jgi:hypothetical protein